MTRYIIITTLASAVLFGCSSSNKADPSSKDENNQAFEKTITDKYWKLVVLEGKPITMVKNQEKEAYFILKTDTKRIAGFSGCNSFSGTYLLEKGNRIRFDNMASTMKACPDVAIDEGEFLQVFELTDNYTIRNDTLNLNVGKRAPLAVFKAIYFD